MSLIYGEGLIIGCNGQTTPIDRPLGICLSFLFTFPTPTATLDGAQAARATKTLAMRLECQMNG